jgi:hypothetical protein
VNPLTLEPDGLRQWVLTHPRIARFLLRTDYRAAVLVGAPKGYTLSGYSYLLWCQDKPWGRLWKPFIDGIFYRLFDQVDHCKWSFSAESTAVSLGHPLDGTEPF